MTTVYYVAVLGQSNASSMFNFGADADSGASVLANSLSADLQPTSPGAASSSALTSLVNGTGQTARFATANNVVVQNYALGASGVDGNAHGAPPADLTWWYPDTGTPGALSIAAAAGMSLTLTSLRAQYDDVRVMIVWGQGEADAKRIADGYSDVDTYKAATLAVFDYVRASVGQPDGPVYINEIGVAAYQGTEARWNVGQDIVRAAQDELAAQHDNIYIGAVTLDLPLKDTVHISDDSYEVVGARAANYIAYTQGLTDVVTGPRPTPDPDNKVDPSDNLPVGTPDVVSLAVTTTGNLLANDHDPDGDVLAVAQVAGSGSVKAIYASGATIQGRFGSLTVNRDGSYAYVVDPSLAATRTIAAGQIGTDIFTYVINDGRGGTASSTLSVLIDGQNDAPVAVNDAAVAASSVPDPLTGNVISGAGGVSADSDPDAGDTISVALIATGSSQMSLTSSGGSLVGSYGALTMLQDGTYRYAIDQGNSAVSALLSGQSLTDHFVYTIVDSGGLASSASLDIIVQKYPGDVTQFGTPTILGKEAADNIGGTADNDIISGLGGNDILKGNNGNDVLLGGAGDDNIQGNEGNDTIVGGAGRDTVKGSNGSDVFFFAALGDAGDVIQDLRSVDFINVAQILNLAPGTPGLDAFAFEYLKVEQAGADVILSIDPDGRAGPAGFVTLATLQATTVGAVLSTQFIVSAAGTLPVDPSAPIAISDTFVVSEDAPESLIGNVLTGAGADVDPNGAELSVVAINGSTGLVGSWITLSTGAHVRVDANGSVQFDTAGKYESLAEGQSLTQKLTYSIFNDFSTTAAGSTATATVLIAGANDTPTVAGPLTLPVIAGSSPATLALLTGAADVDLGDVLSIGPASGLGEGLSITGTTLTIDPTAPRFGGLHVGETTTIALAYDIQDLQGAVVHQTATITVAGSLPVDPRPPVLGAPPSLGLHEGGAVETLDLLAGSSSANAGSALFVTNLTGLSSGMQFSGSRLTIDPGAVAFNQLAAGELQTITLSYTVGDSSGASAKQTAMVTVEGTNDLPSVQDALRLSAPEDTGVIGFDLLTGAADPDHSDGLQVTDVRGLVAGTKVAGASLIVDTADAGFQALADGEAMLVDVSYRITDSHGAAIDQVAHLTIVGMNDTPIVASPLELTAREGDGARTLNLLLGASDRDHGATLSADHVEGLSAGLTVVNNVLAVDLDNAAFDSLAQGQTQSLGLTYAIVDEHGAAVRAQANVVVEGTNDAPTTNGYLTLNATRGDGPVSIDLLRGASDVDNGTVLQIKDLTTLPAGLSLDGTRVVVDPASPAFQSLYDGQSKQLTVVFRIADEFGATTDQKLTVTVAGRGSANAHAVTAPYDFDSSLNHVAENAKAGSLVGVTARATDADPTNNAVTYSLVNTSGEFAMDRQTGVVTVAGAIDFEAGPTRSIVVEARSEDGSTARSTFTVAIDNVNEFAPAITTAASQSVAENTIFVASLTSSDADNPSAPATFSISGGSDAALFAIVGGKLVFNTAHDYEQDQRSYQVQISASDGLYSTAKLITVTLANVAGVSINGTKWADLIDATHSPIGQPRPTGEEDALVGGSGNDTLWGLGGNDVLNGGDGADQMIGGVGDDTYYAGSNGDVVVEGASAGIDTVVSSISYVLGGNVESLVLSGTGALSATGNSEANSITGNSGANIIDGKSGADTMCGGTGNDTYYIDTLSDRVIESAGGGTDRVFAAASFVLSSNVESLYLSGTASLTGTGNSANNSISGNSGNNALDGGAGRDTLTGGKGVDTFIFRSGESAGDVVTDFDGARMRGGDVLRFENFGRGWITQNGSSDFYTIHGDASHNVTETIQIVGVYNLNLTAGSNGDVLFV